MTTVKAPIQALTLPTTDDISINLQSFIRHLRAENLSPKTCRTYEEAVNGLDAYLAANGMPRLLTNIRREHIESFIQDQITRHSPATASVRYGGLRSFFKWAEEEGEVKANPMAKMHPPKVPENVIPILGEAEVLKMLKVCSGNDFESRRDLAILRLFATTGARKAEVANLTLDSLDLEQGIVRVNGKGARERLLPLDARTVRSLDRYVRIRAGHRDAHLKALWLGKRGGMTPDGIDQMARRRADEAGVSDFHLHRFRHTAAHQFLADGGQESDLMRLTGWRSRTMLTRYAASAATERALQAGRQFGLASRI